MHTEKNVRIAVIGGGFGAGQHWHEHPDCEVTAVAEMDEERLGTLVKRYGCENTFRSLEEMLDKARDAFDAVAIFSGAPRHAENAIACMEAGKHVVSACPAGLTLDECSAIIETKEKTGLRYMMHESSYYRQACIAAREAYEAGEFGRLFYSEVEYYHPGICTSASGLSLRKKERTWRWGFPPMLYPTHSLGFLVGVTGERIVKVSCAGQLVGDDFPPVDENPYRNPFNNEMALGITDQGNICRFGVFWSGTAHGERAQWFGDKMSCYMASSGGQREAMQKAGENWQAWDVEKYWQTRLPDAMRHESGHGGSASFLAAEFINAILEDREPAVDVYESIAMTAPGIVAHESAKRNGEQMDVPSFDPTE